MYRLDWINNLQISRGSVKDTNEMIVSATFSDFNSTSGDITKLLDVRVLTNGTTVTEVVPASGSNFRDVKRISVVNSDVVTDTVYIYESANIIFGPISLKKNYSLHYEDAKGWYVLDDNGAVVQLLTGSSGGYVLPVNPSVVDDIVVFSDTTGGQKDGAKKIADLIPITQKAAASGVASLDGSSLVVQNPANATAVPTASKIPIADGSGKLDGWVTSASVKFKWSFSFGGQASGTSAGLAKAWLTGSNYRTSDDSNQMQNGQLDPYLAIRACKIKTIQLACCQAAVNAGTKGASVSIRLDIYTHLCGSRSLLSTQRIVITPLVSVGVSNSLGTNADFVGSATGLSLQLNAGQAWGIEFKNETDANTHANAVGRLFVTVETQDD